MKWTLYFRSYRQLSNIWREPLLQSTSSLLLLLYFTSLYQILEGRMISIPTDPVLHGHYIRLATSKMEYYIKSVCIWHCPLAIAQACSQIFLKRTCSNFQISVSTLANLVWHFDDCISIYMCQHLCESALIVRMKGG